MHRSTFFPQEQNIINVDTANVSYIRASAFLEGLRYEPLIFLNYKVIRFYSFFPSIFHDENQDKIETMMKNLDRHFNQTPVFDTIKQLEKEYEQDDLIVIRYIWEFDLNKSQVEFLIKIKDYQTLLQHLKAVHPDERTKAMLHENSINAESIQVGFNSETFAMEQIGKNELNLVSQRNPN